jgi:hypothetical protein
MKKYFYIIKRKIIFWWEKVNDIWSNREKHYGLCERV